MIKLFARSRPAEDVKRVLDIESQRCPVVLYAVLQRFKRKVILTQVESLIILLFLCFMLCTREAHNVSPRV
jgi:hypothetical protein